jgi:hypothetical protein
MTENPKDWVPLVITGEPTAQELQSQLIEEKKSLSEEQEITQSASKLPEFRQPTLERKEIDPLRNFKDKMKTWPIHLSYEGSALLCIILALNEQTRNVSLKQLPTSDQELIKKALGEKIKATFFEVEFDHIKDFVLTFGALSEDKKDVRNHKLTAFNTVAHPRPEDLRDAGSPSIKIEENGEKIQVGGKITLNKKTIDRVVGNMEKPLIQEEEHLKRSYGKNAYEIRADVLLMAVDWGRREGFIGNEDDVLKIARKFYAFVENKR